MANNKKTKSTSKIKPKKEPDHRTKENLADGDRLSKSQLKQQDFVDNAIYELLNNINPSQEEIEWDIEIIGDIRDAVCHWLVENRAITDEAIFYPYINTDSS